MSLFDEVMTEVNKSMADSGEKESSAKEEPTSGSADGGAEPERKPEKKRFHEYSKDFRDFAGEPKGDT